MLPCGNHCDQRLIHKTGQHLKRHAGGDDAGGLGIESADKHRQTPKCGLLDGIEKGIAPLDRGTNTAVVPRRTLPRPGQFTQVAFQADSNFIQRHDAHPGISQLNAERKMINPGADVEDGGFCVVIRNQPRPSFPGALQEQAVGMLGRKRLQPPQRFTRDAERLAAGCQNTKIRTGAKQCGAELRAPVEDMLTVVEQQQHIAIGQVPAHRISRRVPRRATDVEHTRRLGSDVFCRAHRGKINQPDAIGPLPRLTTTELDGRSGLAHPGRSGQRHQPGPTQHVADGLELRCTADQRRERRGYGRNLPRRSILFAPLLQPAHDIILASHHRAFEGSRRRLRRRGRGQSSGRFRPRSAGGSSALVHFGVKVHQRRKAMPATLSASTVIRGLLATLSWRLQWLRRRVRDAVEFGTRLLSDQLSDQLSDYRADDPHIQAHVHGPSPRSVLGLDDSPTVLRDEEVAGSNPVTPTSVSLYFVGFQPSRAGSAP